jgi:tRNA threonylcarbamoyladenosine biosynthesis protein TsaB
MKTLWIDTASHFLYVALTDTVMRFSEQYHGNNNHSEHLLDTIKKGMSEVGWTPKDWDRIVVGIGPGSYTGLRVSLTVAKTLAWTLHIPLYIVSSLDFAMSGYGSKDGLYAVMMRAKKDYHFIKIIEVHQGQFKVIHDEEYLDDPAIHQLLQQAPNAIIITEDEYSYEPLMLQASQLSLPQDIYYLEPNYLRGEM